MTTRASALTILAVLAGIVCWGMPSGSGATFTSGSRTTGTVAAASDWTVPTVSLRDPGSPVKDTISLVADAADERSGIASVTVEFLAANGSGWLPVCTASAAPYTCAWNTKAVADGAYDLRARATDNVGLTATSATVRTTVANNLLVVLTAPADVVRGTVTLTANLYNAGVLPSVVRIEYAPSGATNWRTVCTALLVSPYTCSWNTTTFANQDYDLRAVATVGVSTYTSAVVTEILVDNAAPTVTMQDPGTPLRGSVTLTATAADAHSGVTQVVLQYTTNTTWLTACTIAVEPWTCRFDTMKVADGSYSFRAVATDVAGNSTTSTGVTGRVVDNTVSSVSVEDPGAYLTGTVTVSALANSTAGVASVRLQRAPSGTSTWTDLCTDTTSPYSCSWDTTTVTDGLYDLRAVLTDGQARTTTSAVVSGRRVDNSPLRGVNVQTVSGGATAGKLDNGDSITFTYSSQVQLGSISAGWTGTALPVTLRLRDGNLVGAGNIGDTLDILRSSGTVNLGSVNLRAEYIKSSKTVQFAATLTAATTTVNGVPATVVTVTLGAVTSGTGLRSGNPGTMVWTPSALATDLSGRACSAAPATEAGALDRDF
jgi:hypothetical protein